MNDEDLFYGCGCLVGLVWVLGMIIAVVVSWDADHSILKAAIHGMLGWLWLGYRFIAASAP